MSNESNYKLSKEEKLFIRKRYKDPSVWINSELKSKSGNRNENFRDKLSVNGSGIVRSKDAICDSSFDNAGFLDPCPESELDESSIYGSRYTIDIITPKSAVCSIM